MEHQSERLGRAFEPGDWLYPSEALFVLSLNAGRHVSATALYKLVERGQVHTRSAGHRRRQYLYDDLAHLRLPGPGQPPDELAGLKANVRAQRAYRARQREKREQARVLREESAEYRSAD